MDGLPSNLIEILGQLSAEERRLFACDCAEHVLPYFEHFHPSDNRPRMAIEVAREYALGQANPETLELARADAEAAAWEARNVAQSDTAPSAAVAAENCARPNADDALTAANTAVEVMLIAAVGQGAADAVWRGEWNAINEAQYQSYQEAEAQERGWQLELAEGYLIMHFRSQ